MCANKTKDAIEEEARNTQANSNGNLWYICTFHERSFAFLFFQWACIVFPLLPLLEHLTLDAGSLARFLLLFLQLIWTFLYNFFLVQLLSFLSFSLGARCCSGQIHCRKRELSGAESITRPKLYTLHCQHQSLSQCVSESTWLHYSY